MILLKKKEFGQLVSHKVREKIAFLLLKIFFDSLD